ncbi:hypothetical protein M3Y97_00176100 [Aphelenchoides bicaudatus]|nr:hypothetical protein M3Y97_00176100 [Aphelenchoides bicaudatus]
MRPPKMPAVARPLSPVESDATMESNEEVKLRFNRHYRRSQSVEPAARKSRTTNSKRIRASQFNYIDEEESENNENNPHNGEPKNKRSKSGRMDEMITTVTTITMDVSGRQPTRGSIEVRKSGSKKRSVSASRILDDNSARRQLIPRPGRIINAPSSVDLRHKTPTALGGSWTHGNAISECRHRFNDYRTLLGSCGVCNRQITIMGKGLQCEVCKICIHEKCRKRAPVPCLPPASFPTPGRNADTKLPLRGYCPNAPPYIPALLIRCICELEKNRLSTEGIYRIPGNREDTNRLYKEFNNSNYIPNLSSEATEVITSCIKLFLKKLKDSLIPRSSYNEFMKADDDDRLAEALGELPDPNRDTLAYLCLHLQKVAMNAAQNKMTIENLAAILCPTILGNNAELNTLGYAGGRNIDQTRNDPFEEVARQRIVLERLLKMSSEFWSDYLNTRTCSQAFTPINTTPKTHRVPATCPANTRNPSTGSSGRADCSVLGPVSSTPPQNFTPRFAGSRRIEPLF